MQDFQAFTVKYSGRTNVLQSEVAISAAFDPTIVVKVNRPQSVKAMAIWDTGASCSVISKNLAQKIGLVPSGKTTITGVNHTTLENTYLVNVYLPNNVCAGYIRIAEVPALSGGADVLIGMDIIGEGDFSLYLENGCSVMNYRLPSIGGTDYVVLAGNINNQQALRQKIMNENQIFLE